MFPVHPPKPLVCLPILLTLLLSAPAPLAAADPSALRTSAGRPWVSLKDAAPIPIDGGLRSALAVAEPRSLAAADLDDDGVPELAAGYDDRGAGLVAIFRGNADPHRPHTPEARERKAKGLFRDEPFLPGGPTLAFALPADRVAFADVDADGRLDVVVAAFGAPRLEWRAGRSDGSFGPLSTVELPAPLTAFADGEVNRLDGLSDIVVAVGGAEPRLLVFESPDGAFGGPPESFSLPAVARSIAVGRLEPGALSDIAALAGDTLVFVHGRRRDLAVPPENRRAGALTPVVDRVPLDRPVEAIAFGDFESDETSQREIALLARDGGVRVARLAPPSETGEPATLRLLRAVATGRPAAGALFVPAKLSSLPGTDLFVAGGDRRTPALLLGNGPDRDPSAPRPDRSRPLGFDAAPLAAVLPLPLGPSALDGLVVLPAGAGATPQAAPAQPMATYTVINTNPTGAGSLAGAIASANASAGADYIDFAIPGAGVPVISLAATGLTGTTESVTIDGTTQSAGRVQVAGPGTFGTFDSGVTLGGSNVAVYNLVVTGFSRGIYTFGSGGHMIRGCRVGTNAAGTAASPNDTGIYLTGGASTVGGLLASDRNLVSGNATAGISTGSSSTDNIVWNNWIGLNSAGTGTIANLTGVRANSSTIIGSASTAARNVVSGNGTGIWVGTLGTSSTIQGNYIGTGTTGTTDLGNSTVGVLIQQPDLQLGGTTSSARNVISGNQVGVRINSVQGYDATIQGNHIGTDAAGTADLGNSGDGIEWSNGQNLILGGTSAGARNVISGNNDDGVSFVTPSSAVVPSYATLLGNWIGLSSTGLVPLPNAVDGIYVYRVSWTTIGGTAAGSRNVVSGNGAYGLRLSAVSGESLRLDLFGNVIGLDKDGSGDVGNGSSGILVSNLSNINIGSSAAGGGNVISGNAEHGIRIIGASTELVSIYQNVIGLALDGSTDRGNTLDGIRVEGGFDIFIGNLGPAANGNTISGNDRDGVALVGVDAIRVTYNRIGTDSGGTLDRGNTRHGVLLDATVGCLVGGTGGNQTNVISGNGSYGVLIQNGADGNSIGANRIGTNAAGTAAIPNSYGIVVLDSTNNSAGAGPTSGGNLVSGNTISGITVSGAGSTGNRVSGNSVGTNLARDTAIPNGVGIVISGASNTLVGGSSSLSTEANTVAGNTGDGIRINSGATANMLLGNAIGMPVGNSLALPNGGDGIEINGAPANQVGGDVLVENANWIAANAGAGIRITGAAATGNTVIGNILGIPPGGGASIPNLGDGIAVVDAPANTIGLSTPLGRNVVCASGGDGIEISATSAGAAAGNLVRGNRIGIDALGYTRTNSGAGIRITGAAGGNTIGGTSAGEGNRILTAAGQDGVEVEGGSGHTIRGNRFTVGAGAIPIDLAPAGATPNDVGDGDAGPNNIQNWPTLSSQWSSGGLTWFSGTLNSAANTTYTVDIYANSGSGGIGDNWIATASCTTGPTGWGSFTTSSSATPADVTLIATAPDGSTSEFSSTWLLPGAPGRVVAGTLAASKSAGTSIFAGWLPATCATDHTIYWGSGTTIGPVTWSGAACALGTSGSATFDPGAPPANGLIWFVVAGTNGIVEGSYGVDSSGGEIPEAVGVGSCDLPQLVASECS